MKLGWSSDSTIVAGAGVFLKNLKKLKLLGKWRSSIWLYNRS